jgi:rhodanese-related sulfurtransferase
MKLLSVTVLAFGCLSLAPDYSAVPFKPDGIEIVGPSVLLNAQATGRPVVYDLREKGRAIPEAIAPPQHPVEGAFLIGNVEIAGQFIQKHRLDTAFIVPTYMVEFEHEKGVPQITPKDAKTRGLPIFDISEAFEFERLAIPDSHRFDFMDFNAKKWDALPQNKPFVIACRVGHRSQLVTHELRKNGYDAINLDGGLWQWEVDDLGMRR